MFIFAYKKESGFSEILLNSPGENPTDDTYVNIYYTDNGISLTTLDNEGNVLEFEGEIEQ